MRGGDRRRERAEVRQRPAGLAGTGSRSPSTSSTAACGIAVQRRAGLGGQPLVARDLEHDPARALAQLARDVLERCVVAQPVEQRSASSGIRCGSGQRFAASISPPSAVAPGGGGAGERPARGAASAGAAAGEERRRQHRGAPGDGVERAAAAGRQPGEQRRQRRQPRQRVGGHAARPQAPCGAEPEREVTDALGGGGDRAGLAGGALGDPVLPGDRRPRAEPGRAAVAGIGAQLAPPAVRDDVVARRRPLPRLAVDGPGVPRRVVAREREHPAAAGVERRRRAARRRRRPAAAAARRSADRPRPARPSAPRPCSGWCREAARR